MFNKRKGKQRLSKVPTLCFLFCVYMLGTAFGGVFVFHHNVFIPFSAAHRSFVSGFGRCMIYYAFILIFSRMPWGICGIPVIVFVRAFVYSVAISMFIGNGSLHWSELLELFLPAVIYLSGLLYLAYLSFSMSLCRFKKCALRTEMIREFRRGVLYAGSCAVIGAVTEAVLYIS